MTGLGPFDLPGVDILALYGVLLIMAAITSLAIPHWLRPDGRLASVSDPDELAYLAGGARRCVDAVLTRLYARGDLAIGQDRVIAQRQVGIPGAGAAEILRLGLTFPTGYANAHKQLRGFNKMIHDRLVEAGLLMDFDQLRRVRFWQTMPFLILILAATITLPVWSVGWLFVSGFSLLAAVLSYALVDRKTRAGNAVIEDAQRAQERLHRAAPRDEADLAVALFGAAALAGSAYAELYRTSSGLLAMLGRWGAGWHISASTSCGGGGTDGSGSGSGSAGCGGGCGGGD